MNETSRRSFRVGTALLAALALASMAAAKDGKDAKETRDEAQPLSFQAFAVNMDARAGAAAGPIDINIERWTTPEERAKLRTSLTQKGSDALLDTLQDTKKAGTIRATGGGLGWDIHYARREALPDGGYRVVFATDRPMSFYERTDHPRSADYEFLVGELHVDRDGHGEGKLVPAAKVTFNKGENAIEIENYSNEPVQLTKVTELKSRPKAASEDRDEKDKASSRDRE
jgi:hypothetical protein